MCRWLLIGIVMLAVAVPAMADSWRNESGHGRWGQGRQGWGQTYRHDGHHGSWNKHGSWNRGWTGRHGWNRRWSDRDDHHKDRRHDRWNHWNGYGRRGTYWYRPPVYPGWGHCW